MLAPSNPPKRTPAEKAAAVKAARSAVAAKIAALKPEERSLGRVAELVGGPLKAFDAVPAGWKPKTTA